MRSSEHPVPAQETEHPNEERDVKSEKTESLSQQNLTFYHPKNLVTKAWTLNQTKFGSFSCQKPSFKLRFREGEIMCH